jgi:peptidyl-prolyl cis-trans isomerase D
MPIQTDAGVFVIRVDRRVEADRKAWEAQKETQRQQAMQAMQQARIQEFMRSLRANAKITDRRKDIQLAQRQTNS